MKTQRFSRKVKITGLFLCLMLVSLQIYLLVFLFRDVIFDRFLYRKSPWHGYNFNTGLCPSFVNSDGFRDGEFYQKKPGEYLILVVGDSIVYGQGLLASQRFSNQLEKMLDKIQPTRVFNLGTCGSNIYNHYLIAKRFQKELKPDLTVITFYENDLLVWDSQRDFPRQLTDAGNLIRDFANVPSVTGEQYPRNILGAFDETTDNWRMLKFIIPWLPKEKAIYLFAYYTQSNLYDSKIIDTFNLFRQNGLNAIITTDILEQKYSGKKLEISSKERHPNKQTNQMFAQKLYREIITNPDYGFSPVPN